MGMVRAPIHLPLLFQAHLVRLGIPQRRTEAGRNGLHLNRQGTRLPLRRRRIRLLLLPASLSGIRGRFPAERPSMGPAGRPQGQETPALRGQAIPPQGPGRSNRILRLRLKKAPAVRRPAARIRRPDRPLLRPRSFPQIQCRAIPNTNLHSDQRLLPTGWQRILCLFGRTKNPKTAVPTRPDRESRKNSREGEK